MGDGYKTQLTGMAAINERFRAIDRQLAAIRAAANLRNSSITGGDGLTIGFKTGPHIQLAADKNALVGGSILINDGVDPDVSATMRGSTNALSLRAPFDTTGPATGTAALDLIGNPSAGIAPKIVLQAGDAGLAVYDAGAGIGAEPYVDLGAVQVYDDGSSSRIVGLGAALTFPSSAAEVRVRTFDDSAYTTIRASAFTVSSSEAVKQDIADLGWSPLEIVKAAKAKQWRYQPTEGDPDRLHVGPIAEDLPDELVDHTGPTPGVDLAVLVGVLWAAMCELAVEVAALKANNDAPGLDFPPGTIFDFGGN